MRRLVFCVAAIFPMAMCSALAETMTLSFTFPDGQTTIPVQVSRCLPAGIFITQAEVIDSFGVGVHKGKPNEKGPLNVSATVNDEGRCVTLEVTHVKGRKIYGKGRGLYDGVAKVETEYIKP